MAQDTTDFENYVNTGNSGYNFMPDTTSGTSTPSWSTTSGASAAGIGAGALGIAGLLTGGDLTGSGARGQALQSYQDVVNMIMATGNPDLVALIPQLQKAVVAGQVTPVQVFAQLQANNAFDNVQSNPNLTQDQMDVLNQYKDIANNGGMTAVDRANVQNSINQENQAEAGQRTADLQSAQQRGVAGSGLEMLSHDISTQAAANRSAANATNLATAAQTRALNALQNSGTLAGNMQAAQLSQANAKATAQNAINNYNTGVQNTVAQNNANAANAAQAANVNNAQAVANKNTDISNTQSMLPLTETEQQYQDLLNKNKAAASALSGVAGQQNAQANANANTTSGIASAAMTYGPMIASYFSDETKKKDVHEMSDSDVDELLNNLTGYKYKYDKHTLPIDNATANKQQYGVMAQDLEKTPMAGSVIDTNIGKVVAGDPMDKNAQLAVLANLHKRMKNLENK